MDTNEEVNVAVCCGLLAANALITDLPRELSERKH